MLGDVLESWGGYKVPAYDVYADIFHLGEGLIQTTEESRNLKSNPLGYWKEDGKKSGHYRIFFEDSFKETLRELQDADFAITNGITYFGKKNAQANANKMFCMIFDLDGVTDKTLNSFLSGAIKGGAYPVPNYVALSGHGVHLYYLFEDPVPLYPNIKLQLKELKYALTEKLWNKYTSEEERKQFQGINQGFRPIGGKTKIENVRILAYKLNEHPFTLKELCDFVPEEYRIDEKALYRESKMTLAEARKKFPEWYQKRVVEGNTSKGHWTCKRELYEWWKNQIRKGATYHHRYFSIMCLAIYAVKSGVSEEDLRKDSYELLPFLNAINPEEPFTESDVESALECYDERYFTFPIDDISKLSGITIEKNKRNGRSRKDHISQVNDIRKLRRDKYGEDTYKNNGRPSKENIIQEWKCKNPDGSKARCIAETGLSKPTVYKHWEQSGESVILRKMKQKKNNDELKRRLELLQNEISAMQKHQREEQDSKEKERMMAYMKIMEEIMEQIEEMIKQ